MIKINREELAWAAGFFDGEGYIGLQWSGPYSGLRMTVTQKRLEPLHRFQNAVGGIGSISTERDRDRQPCSLWRVNKFENVQAVFAMLFPFLSPPKREQGIKTLTDYWKTAVRRVPYGKRTHCKHGHDLTDHWIGYTPNGTPFRICKECRRISNQKRSLQREENSGG